MYFEKTFDNVNTMNLGAGRDKMDKTIVYGAVRFSVFEKVSFLANKD